MNILNIGIDNGNYNTKSSERMLYASGFTMSEKEFITDDMQLFYDGKYYAVGGKRMSFQQDKTKEDDAFILSLPAIAHAMKQVGITSAEMFRGVGLPIDIYGAQKETFRKYFLRGSINFDFEGILYSCRIMDCKVFPQGHAALCKYYQQLKGYTNITLIDIGGYTVEILTLHEFKVDRGSCASLRMGTITLFNAIREELQQENIILSDTLITDAMQGRLQHADQDRVQLIVERRMRLYIRELLNALRERGLDLKLPVAFAGGGAELFGRRLYSGEVNTITILDCFANAEGCISCCSVKVSRLIIKGRTGCIKPLDWP